MSDAITRRTFAAVLAASRLSASAKRELLALHHAEVADAREAAAVACTPASLVDAARESAVAAAEMGFHAGVCAHAQETQRFTGATMERAEAAYADAQQRWRRGASSIVHPALDAMERGIAAARAQRALPAQTTKEDHDQ